MARPPRGGSLAMPVGGGALPWLAAAGGASLRFGVAPVRSASRARLRQRPSGRLPPPRDAGRTPLGRLGAARRPPWQQRPPPARLQCGTPWWRCLLQVRHARSGHAAARSPLSRPQWHDETRFWVFPFTGADDGTRQRAESHLFELRKASGVSKVFAAVFFLALRSGCRSLPSLARPLLLPRLPGAPGDAKLFPSPLLRRIIRAAAAQVCPEALALAPTAMRGADPSILLPPLPRCFPTVVPPSPPARLASRSNSFLLRMHSFLWLASRRRR